MTDAAPHDTFSDWFDQSYAPASGQWYAMRATYGRATRAMQICEERPELYPCKCYVPIFKTREKINGHARNVTRAYMDNLLYIFATRQVADLIAADKGPLSFINYYYDHFSHIYKDPLVIRHEAMKNFMRYMHAQSDDKRLVQRQHVHYRNGDLVEVLDGPFKGVQGRIARVMGQQRVVVDNGACIAVTSYIATPLLRVIEPGKYDK